MKKKILLSPEWLYLVRHNKITTLHLESEPDFKVGDTLLALEKWATVKVDYNWEVTWAIDSIHDLKGLRITDLKSRDPRSYQLYHYSYSLIDDPEEQEFRWISAKRMPIWAVDIYLEVIDIKHMNIDDMTDEEYIKSGLPNLFDRYILESNKKPIKTMYQEKLEKNTKSVWVVELKPYIISENKIFLGR